MQNSALSEIKETLRLFDNEVLWIWLVRPLFLVLCHFFPFPAFRDSLRGREKETKTRLIGLVLFSWRRKLIFKGFNQFWFMLLKFKLKNVETFFGRHALRKRFSCCRLLMKISTTLSINQSRKLLSRLFPFELKNNGWEIWPSDVAKFLI